MCARAPVATVIRRALGAAMLFRSRHWSFAAAKDEWCACSWHERRHPLPRPSPDHLAGNHRAVCWRPPSCADPLRRRAAQTWVRQKTCLVGPAPRINLDCDCLTKPIPPSSTYLAGECVLGYPSTDAPRPRDPSVALAGATRRAALLCCGGFPGAAR